MQHSKPSGLKAAYLPLPVLAANDAEQTQDASTPCFYLHGPPALPLMLSDLGNCHDVSAAWAMKAVSS